VSSKVAQEIRRMQALEPPIPIHKMNHSEELIWYQAIFATCRKNLEDPQHVGALMSQAAHRLEELRMEEGINTAKLPLREHKDRGGW
jgi:hypothetical protein